MPEFDVCVIGSGFGGVMAAWRFVEAGFRVVMLERGDWVERGPHNWAASASVDMTPAYNRESPYRVVAGGNEAFMGSYNCVGGPSVFYGGVSLRFREADFDADRSGDSHARWPFGYRAIEPYYEQAEALLDVAGEAGEDPTEPPRSTGYPQPAAPLSALSGKLADAGRSMGLRPFRLPLAINYRAGGRRCQLCATCDTYACAVSAKNDLSATLIPTLQARGLELRHSVVAVRLVRQGPRIAAVECRSRGGGATETVRAKWFVLAAGALASPHLVLASGLDSVNPASQHVGRHLMRHINAIVFGLFPAMPARLDTFHKQIGFHDFYFGHPSARGPRGRLGALQQVHSPPVELVKKHMPGALGAIVAPLAKRMTGLLALGEDQPNAANHVRLAARATDRFGLRQLEIEHRYSARDLAVVATLARQAKGILRRAGAVFFYTHHIRTFSHAVGTLRLGDVPEQAPVDEFGRFRGIDNLSVTDGSVFPTSAAVNPSLTISALALRSADHVVEAGLVR